MTATRTTRPAAMQADAGAASALAAAGAVRDFEPADAEAVARLFLTIFRKSDAAPPTSLVACFRDLFGSGTGQTASRVFAEADGRVTGFMGVLPAPFRLDDRVVPAVMVGSLMVEDHARNPLAGARLLRAVVTGRQPMTLSETANAISQRLWEPLGGRPMPGYSLDWIRVLRPAAFAVALAGRAWAPLRHLAPLARLPDALATRFTAVPPAPGEASELPLDEAARAILALSAPIRFRPDWDAAEILRRLTLAAGRRGLGPLVALALPARRGEPQGIAVYHAPPAGVAQVLNILARPGREGDMVAHLLSDAFARGAAALKGRAEPATTDAIASRSAIFLRRAALIGHARDAALLAPIRSGDALVTGLAAETWIPLIGGEFT